MQGVRLDHTTINTDDVEGTVAFFEEHLGLRPGHRPDLDIPGAWLYPHDGDYPIVHLIGVDEVNEPGGNVDHVAFRGTDMAIFVAKLRADDVEFTMAAVPGTPLSQVHLFDPNGVKIEVTFEEPLPDPG